MNNNKAFTLMEILAVLLVIAVVASFTVPVIKSVRREMRYQKAKTAGVQIAEAVRSFYTDTKGCLVSNMTGFLGGDMMTSSCNNTNPIKTGIPASENSDNCGGVNALFGCKYISTKVFTDLPYTFYVADKANLDEFLVKGVENPGGENARWFSITRDMVIVEDDD